MKPVPDLDYAGFDRHRVPGGTLQRSIPPPPRIYGSLILWDDAESRIMSRFNPAYDDGAALQPIALAPGVQGWSLFLVRLDYDAWHTDTSGIRPIGRR